MTKTRYPITDLRLHVPHCSSYTNTVPFPCPQNANKPKPQPRSKLPPAGPEFPSAPPELDFPSLPNVPSDLPDVPRGGGGAGAAGKRDDDDEIDFDELSRRFENLKKRK